ncbi:MAG: hypothetical protein ABEJ79_02220 [Halolamina sp.]
MVSLPASVLARYRRFSLYNSPYAAHDRGRAVDLYPDDPAGVADDRRRGAAAPSPVAGEVIETRTVACPDRPYAVGEDHLVVVATDPDGYAEGRLARILHVDPAVEPGDRVAVGDPLGRTVRSGFFGRWVADHIHLGFRPPEANPVRASGSLALSVDVDVEPIAWDGVGTVVDVGPTYARLDAPAHPDPDDREWPDGDAPTWVGLAGEEDRPLDGGLPHYGGGGSLSGGATGAVSLLGTEVATAADGDVAVTGRDLDWGSVGVYANGVRATGLSLFASRVDFGTKLVFHEGHDFAVGDEVTVRVRPVADRIRLDD